MTKKAALAPTKAIFLAMASVLFSSLTLVLGAIPLHGWRQAYGKKKFLIGLGILVFGAVAAGWYPLAAAVACLGLLISLFNDFDERGLSLLKSASLSVFITCGAFLIGVQAWLSQSGQTWKEMVRTPIEAFLSQMSSVNKSSAAAQVPIDDVLAQLPSGVVIVLMAALFFSLLFEPRMHVLLGLPERNRQKDFLSIRMPDSMVWLTIFALLAAFLKFEMPGLKELGTNLLNVIIFLYFVQGMAVVTQFFVSNNVNPIWRTLSYVLLVLQFFLFVSCLGFVDFWVDFRQKILNRGNEKLNGKGGIQ